MTKRTTFLIIERALIPSPPIDSEPYWCYINTLLFHDKSGREVWQQEIPEAKLNWSHQFKYDDKKKRYEYNCDEFDKYFHCEVFKDKNLGWQLRITLSHGKADFWHKQIIEFIEEYHKEHFKLKEEREKTLNGGTNFTKSSADDFPYQESLISVKRESADSPNSPHDSSTIKEEANFS